MQIWLACGPQRLLGFRATCLGSPRTRSTGSVSPTLGAAGDRVACACHDYLATRSDRQDAANLAGGAVGGFTHVFSALVRPRGVLESLTRSGSTDKVGGALVRGTMFPCCCIVCVLDWSPVRRSKGSNHLSARPCVSSAFCRHVCRCVACLRL